MSNQIIDATGFGEALLREMSSPASKRSSYVVWKGGVKPPNFIQFCEMLDGYPMFERQKEAFIRANLVEPEQFLGINRDVSQFVFMWGKGSGKDYLISKLFAYMPFLFMHLLGDPINVLSGISGRILASRSTIDCMNIAPDLNLGRQVFFGNVKKHFQRPMFSALNIEPPPAKFKSGTEEVVILDYNMRFVVKSSRVAGADGYNLLLTAMDEADEFRDANGFKNAELLDSVLTSSANTRFGECKLNLTFSYPRIKRGFMMAMKERSERNPHLIFFDKATTAEVRPDFSIEEPAVKEEFENDPALAAAKYLCEPMEVEQVWFENPDALSVAPNPLLTPCASYVVDSVVVTNDRNIVLNMQSLRLTSGIRYEADRDYVIAIDGGRKGDSAAICVMSFPKAFFSTLDYICDACAGDYEDIELSYKRSGMVLGTLEGYSNAPECSLCLRNPLLQNGEWQIARWWVPVKEQVEESTLKAFDGELVVVPIREEMLIEVKPVRETYPARYVSEVDFLSIEQVVQELAIALRVSYIGFDSWQTAQMQQNLHSKTPATILEISMANSRQFQRGIIMKRMVNRNLIDLLPNQPKRDLEWRQLQNIGNYKIDHDTTGSKDLYDSEAMVVAIIVCQQNREFTVELLGENSKEKVND